VGGGLGWGCAGLGGAGLGWAPLPAGFPRHLCKPMPAQTAHDRYAGFVGLLPPLRISAGAGLSMKSALSVLRRALVTCAWLHFTRLAVDAYTGS